MRFPEKTLRAWPNVEDVEVNLVPQYTWQNQIVPLKAIDPAARTATLRCPLPAYSVTAGSPFRVENVPEGVTRPGTWAVDTRAGTVTLWPEDGVDLAKAVVTAPALRVLVRCVGSEKDDRLVRGLSFRGLTFTQTDRVPLHERDPKDTGTLDTNDCAVLLDGAEDCAIEDCRFVETGGYGVRLRHAAKSNRVTGCEFAGCGGGGVLLTGYGPGTRDVNRGNVVAGNHIHHCGAFYWHAAGIALTQSGENVIAFNEIHDMPYGGILVTDCSVDYFKEFRGKQGRGFQFRWEEIGNDPLTFQSVKRFTHSRKNQIAYNTIHHVMQRLEDGGGIHIGFVGGENVVRGNLIHGVRASRSGWGLYTDAETNRELIEGNVVWDCGATHIDYEHGGRNNNRWVGNVLSARKEEPPEAKALRDTIAARRKKGLNSAGRGALTRKLERSDMPNPTPTRPAAIVSRRDFLRAGTAAATLGPAALFAADRDDTPPDLLIGYTEFRTDLPGGRYVSVATMRAAVVKADGTGRRVLAEELTREKNSWTQFRGWSPDGKTAIFSAAGERRERQVGGGAQGSSATPRAADSCDGYLFDLAAARRRT